MSYSPSTLRYIDEAGKEHIAGPHDPMYSTLTMLATHYWKDGKWELINPVPDSELPDADDSS